MMWFASRRSTPAAVMSGRWSGWGLTSGLNASDASTVSSWSAAFLSAELESLFPEDNDDPPNYAYCHTGNAQLRPLAEVFRDKPYLQRLSDRKGRLGGHMDMEPVFYLL